MFTKTGKICKTSNFKIKNSLGETTSTNIDNPADYYMFAQENAVGIISYKELVPYLVNVKDGISAKIPHDKITYIITPTMDCPEMIDKIDIACLNYKERKRQMQLEFIMSVPKSA